MGLEEVCVSRPGNSNHSMSTDMGRYFSNRKKREEVEYVVVQLTFSDRGFVPSRGKHLYDLRYPIDVMNSMYSSSGELSDHYFEGGGYLNAAYTYERLRTTATLGDLSENKYTLNDEIKREGKLIKDFYRNISKCKMNIIMWERGKHYGQCLEFSSPIIFHIKFLWSVIILRTLIMDVVSLQILF